MSALPIEDMSSAYIEHSMVINNFVVEARSKTAYAVYLAMVFSTSGTKIIIKL